MHDKRKYMDQVRRPAESVEQRFGESLAARDAAISIAADCSGIGPPDLCWTHKSTNSIFKIKKNALVGHYHWILGLDVKSNQCISEYFASLTKAFEKVIQLIFVISIYNNSLFSFY